MMQESRRYPAELEEALYAFATAPQGPTAKDLDELTRRFPTFAHELTDIAVELALEALTQDEHVDVIEEATSPAISRAMSNFNNRLYEIEAQKRGLETKSAMPNQGPFASLRPDGIAALATRLGANRLFVVKLRDRLINPETISKGFRSFLAKCMSLSVGEINLHLDAQPTLAYGTRYKSAEKPTADARQSFEEAVKSSNLTEDQQTRLLEL